MNVCFSSKSFKRAHIDPETDRGRQKLLSFVTCFPRVFSCSRVASSTGGKPRTKCTMQFPLLMCAAVLASVRAQSPHQSACNTFDGTASARVEAVTGQDTSGASLYESAKGWRSEPAQALQDSLLGKFFGPDQDELMDDLVQYGIDMYPYAVVGVLSFIVIIFVGPPAIFARCCCSRCCCAPHHPLWGQDYGTLEDYPEPTCCGGSRKLDPANPPKDPARPVRPYTFWEQCAPVVAYGIFALLLVAVAIVGTLSAGTVGSGLDDSVCALDGLVVEARNFTYGLNGAISNVFDVSCGDVLLCASY